MLYFCLLLYITAIYVRPSEIVPALAEVPLVDILTGWTVILGAATLLLRPRRFMPMPTDLCIVGFWIAIVLSNIAWGWLGGAWRGFLDFLPVVFCYFLVRFAVETPRQFRGLVYLLVALNLVLAVNGIIQYHTGVGLGGVEAITEDRRIRGTGIFNDPNDLGMTLVMTTAFVLAGIFAAGAKARHRLAWFLPLVPLLLGIYYTNSRGTVVGLGVVLVAFGYRRFRVVSGTLLAATALLLLVVLGPARTSAMDAAEESAQGRIEAWADGLQMLKAKPVFGVGYSRFTEFHDRVAHNSVVHTFAELGLVGVVFLIGGFYSFFRALAQLRRTEPEQEGATHWAGALSVCALGAIACGMFLSRQYVVVPYILLAMGVSRATMGRSDSRQFWSNAVGNSAIVVMLAACSVVTVWIGVRALGAW